ncbi:hypothetical protein CHS0354_024828 [Potamilus streckersoni]|uniref:Protein sleepless n=1 Tax=Potamilus streckersoni TaxID=2493646 RepID=A0AAE0SZM8_9BIVA|nr:hypothetical protein CHS0354_024828 [Potamilus streckersoni]
MARRQTKSCVFLFLVAVLPVATAIVCFQCADSTEKANCQNYSRMRKSRKFYNDNGGSLKYNMKNCTKMNMCAIEEISTRGDIQAYIRDCSDGLTFSFNLTKFRSLLPDNQTTCAYSNNQLVCITLCKTDLCNGPSSASIQMMPLMLILLAISMSIVLKR